MVWVTHWHSGPLDRLASFIQLSTTWSPTPYTLENPTLLSFCNMLFYCLTTKHKITLKKRNKSRTCCRETINLFHSPCAQIDMLTPQELLCITRLAFLCWNVLKCQLIATDRQKDRHGHTPHIIICSDKHFTNCTEHSHCRQMGI